MPKRILLSALLAMLSATFIGCGGTEVKSEVTATKGQQLIDLKAALDAGIISKDEYERERKRVLNK